MMRHFRALAPITAVSVALLSLVACGPDETEKADPGKGTSASSQKATAPEAKLPDVNPATDWHNAGDLCEIIDAATASKALGYTGNLTAEYNSAELPVTNGLDYCHYTDEPNFVLLNVTVLNGMTPERWDQTVAENVGGSKKAYNPKIPGVDESFVNSVGQVLVLKGDVMISVLNNTLHDKVTSEQASNLAATVARLF